MDTETTGAENTLPEQEIPKKSGRPPPIVMTSTTNLIRLQSDLKEHVKGEYEFRNTRNGTRIIAKEMAGYSAMKSYLEKNNHQYFTFSPNSEKPIKVVISHLPPATPAEDISNSLENLGFNIINVRQLTTNRRAPNSQIYVENLPLFLVTLTRQRTMKTTDNSTPAEVLTVAVRLPPFWAERPAVLFAQDEAQFALAGNRSEQTKFCYVISLLNHRYASEVEDFITSQPKRNPYTTLKTELVKRLSPSKEQRIHQLLALEMGDRNPSQLLRHLRSLDPNAQHGFLRRIWYSRLPSNVRAILAGHPEGDLNAAAHCADA
jgi:hypothetical protein